MGILLTDNITAADATAAGNTIGFGATILVYVVFIVGIYFIFSRPQKKEQKRIAAMLASLEIGDCVLTTSGFYGIVIGISDNDDTVIVEFGNNKNCRIPMDKSAINRIEKPENN